MRSGRGGTATWCRRPGTIEVNGVRANTRDGVAIKDEATLTVTAIEDAEIVLVDAA